MAKLEILATDLPNCPTELVYVCVRQSLCVLSVMSVSRHYAATHTRTVQVKLHGNRAGYTLFVLDSIASHLHVLIAANWF